MKIVTIGDIHGESFWEALVEEYSSAEKIIFVGDYLDSFTVKDIYMLHNFKKIITLKKKHPNKYILLLGNHDAQYRDIKNLYGKCSGYRANMRLAFYKLLYDNKKCFQVAYMKYDYLWTHAGVHTGWYKFSFLPEVKKNHPDWIGHSIDTQLNNAYNSPLIHSLYDVGFDRGGFQRIGGPFWVDKNNTWKKALKGYHQIVGHTNLNEAVRHDINAYTSITYVDTYPKGSGHYVINL